MPATDRLPVERSLPMLERLLCTVLGHRPRKVPREDEGGGYTLRCARCGLEGVRA